MKHHNILRNTNVNNHLNETNVAISLRMSITNHLKLVRIYLPNPVLRVTNPNSLIPPQMQQQHPALPHLPGADSGEVETHLGLTETLETHLREKHLSTPEDCPTCPKPSITALPLCWTQSINVLISAILHSK